MRTFAVAMTACRALADGRNATYHLLIVVDARSAEEAEGIGRRYVLFHCPEIEGYRSHNVQSLDADYRLKPEAEWRR